MSLTSAVVETNGSTSKARLESVKHFFLDQESSSGMVDGKKALYLVLNPTRIYSIETYYELHIKTSCLTK
jgi:hypothetical protein